VGEKKENASLLLSCPTERAHIYYTWKWLGEETRGSNGGGEGVWREGLGGSPLFASVSLGVCVIYTYILCMYVCNVYTYVCMYIYTCEGGSGRELGV
jgi:hypothetical protein